MVGLNHEFARELLWREYPTDQRGSYFRQFWDVARLPGRAAAATRRRCASGCATSPSCTAGRTTDDARRPRPPRGAGRQGGGARARDPRRAAEEVPDRRHLRPPRRVGARPKRRRRDRQDASRASSRMLTARRRRTRRATLVKTPLYEAKVDPDIYFFGFDLTAEKAKGGPMVGRRRRTRAGSSSSRSGRASRASASTSPSAAPQAVDQHLERPGVERRRRRSPRCARCAPASGRDYTPRPTPAPARADRSCRTDEDRPRFRWRRRHARRRARLHPLPGAGADGGARRRDAAEGKLMPGFDDTRQELTGLARRARADARRAAAGARSGQARPAWRRRDALRELGAGAAQSLDCARRRACGRRSASSPSPRDALRRLPDRHPILLFPLRLETRFKTVDGQPQLWVRVYPDDAWRTSFEQALTEQEVANAQAFWAGSLAGRRRRAPRSARRGASWRARTASAARAGSCKHHAPLNPARPAATEQAERRAAGDRRHRPLRRRGPPSSGRRCGGQAAPRPPSSQRVRRLEAAVGAAAARRIVEEFTPVEPRPAAGAGETRATNGVKVAVLTAHAAGRPRRCGARRGRARRGSTAARAVRAHGVARQRPSRSRRRARSSRRRSPPAPIPTARRQRAARSRTAMTSRSPTDPLDVRLRARARRGHGLPHRPDAAAGRGRLHALVVLGVRLSETPAEGRSSSRRCSSTTCTAAAGLSCCRRARRPTTPRQESAGYTVRDDPDASVRHRLPRAAGVHAARPTRCCVATASGSPSALGISPIAGASASRTPADATSIEARAMQLALWPGTIGYMMQTMLAPVFADADVDATREFFTPYVSGRGPLPALRIGAQPYGILPVTSLGAVNWFDRTGSRVREVPRRRDAGLPAPAPRTADADRAGLGRPLSRVSFVGKSGPGVDPQQVLLDVLGLHPSSVEFHSLKADSETHKYHLLSLLEPAAGGSAPEEHPDEGGCTRAARAARLCRRGTSPTP